MVDWCYGFIVIFVTAITESKQPLLLLNITIFLHMHILFSLSFLMFTGLSIQENGGTLGIRKMNEQMIKGKFASLVVHVRMKMREKLVNSDDLGFHANTFLGVDIPKSANVNEIFEVVNNNRLWDYWNYYPLKKFILEFAPDDLEAKAMMETYRQDLESYKATEKIIDHIDFFNETQEEEEQLAKYDKRYYQQLSLKIKKKFTEHSLKYIDDLWNEFANLYSLPPHAALLDHIQKGCIFIVWLIPSHLAPQIFYATPCLSGDFYRKHEITRVELDGKCIYDEEHIDNERSEDPVAVASQGSYRLASHKNEAGPKICA